MLPEMEEAARLTREGRLAEAAALIQKTLGLAGGVPPAGGPVDVTARTTVRPVWPGEAVPPGDMDPPATGRWVAGKHAGLAGSRVFKVYVPSGREGRALPLVVMLHGCTQTPDDFATGTGMNALAEAEGILAVYPAQAVAANGSRCWNWFQPDHQERGAGEPAILAGLTRQVAAEYGADPGRVFVAGMSAGGAMAAILAAAYPDLYAAVGVHSGLAPGSAYDLSSALAAMRQPRPGRAPAGPLPPLILFQGDADTTVHPGNAAELVRLWTAAPGPDGRPAAAGPPQVEFIRSTGGRACTRAVTRDTAGRVRVEHWTVHETGHAWSGGRPAGSYTDPAGPDASREMIRFFRERTG